MKWRIRFMLTQQIGRRRFYKPLLIDFLSALSHFLFESPDCPFKSVNSIGELPFNKANTPFASSLIANGFFSGF